MERLRTLSVSFHAPAHAWELPAFRGAVAGKAGYKYGLFHNDTGEFHCLFPFIQLSHLHPSAGHSGAVMFTGKILPNQLNLSPGQKAQPISKNQKP